MFVAIEKFILASASPRRHALLKAIGIEFDIAAAEIDETPKKGEKPVSYASRMANTKCQTVMHAYPGKWVVAADTIVFLGQTILGKPRSDTDAVRILMQLSGKVHHVATSFCIGCLRKKIMCEETVLTQVKFSSFSEKTAHLYVATGEPADKAGGYGIQGKGSVFVEEIHGSYSNVVGLPLAEVVAILNKYGIVKTK